jgi:trimeric autotransporter adhesin
LNAANVNNSLFSASQNNIAYASVGAGLTDDEVYTYYELVDELQTELGRGVTDPNAFITTWDTRITGTGTVTGTSSIALPLFGTQAITASWGDGTVSLISQSAQADRTHSYAEPGIYTVTVTGQSAGFFERYSADKAKLLDIVQWGTVAPPYLTGYSLTGAENLVGTYTDKAPILGGNFRFFLDGATKFNGWANDWDMTGVTSLQSIFNGTRFNQPVDQWVFNPSGVSFNATFNATPFDQNVSAWDVRPVTSFYRAFRGSNFNNGGSPDINNWVFVSASGFTEMFGDKFNQNIGNWDVSKVAGTGSNQSFFSMFKDAVSFNNGGSPDINNWRFNTSSDITMYGMFENADAFNQPIGNWNTERVVSMGWMFHGIQIFDQNIGAWNVEKVISFNSMFGRSGRTSPAFNNGGSPDINNWRPISCSDFNSMFYNAPSFDQPIGNWPLSASNIDMGSMFNGNNSTTKFNQNIGAWDVSRVVNMSSMFFNNNQFNNSGSSDINNWRPISCSGFGGMFYNATAFNQPIGNWPLSASNINMSNMFRNADAFNQNIGAWNVEKVTNMSSMFNGNRDFNNSGSSDINNWTPVSCSDFISMFAGATAFNQPIENWTLPTDRTFTMTSMFNGATAFNQSLGNWNVVSASSMANMLNSSGIDIPNYTKTLRGWGNLANTTGVQTAVPLGASGKKYGAAHAQRKVLTDTYGWTITDGGQEPFVFTINTTASSYNPGTELTFQLPILDANTGSYALDILVNWGDSSTSTISSSTQPDITHTYLNSGSYEITITGSLTGFSFDNGGDKAKLTDVSKWSALEINTIRILRGCSNVTATSTDAPFVSTLFEAFRDCPNFNGNISSWDVSQVSVFQSCFFGASSFNQNIGGWNVSNATVMTSMFRSFVGHAFNQDIGNWNVSNVQYMDNMFSGNNSFNNGGLDLIKNWNVSNVTDMSYMFEGATAFNQDIGNWNVSKVTDFSNFMFGKSAEYDPNYMDSIFNNWPNYKLKPNLTNVHFGSINYTSTGSEGKALLERPHITASITNIDVSASLFQIQATSIVSGLSVGNRITISGSGNPVLDKAHPILQILDINTFTVDVPFTASAIQGEVITGYGWTMITGSQI